MGKKNGSGRIVVVVILLAIAGVIASNFVGPVKGWGDKLLEEPVRRDTADDKDIPTKVDKKVITVANKKDDRTADKKGLETPEVAEKTESEKLFDELLAKYNKKYKPPVVGKKYFVYLTNGAKMAGVLEEFADGKIVLKQKYGKVMYPVQNVNKKSYKTFFPKQVAKEMALKEFNEIMKEKVKAREAAEQAEVASADTTSDYKCVKYEKFTYDTSVTKTTGLLKQILHDFTIWVQAQQRRMGGKITTHVYAKKQAGHVVLYMKVTDMFEREDYDWRFVITEGMWRLWSMKCFDNNQVSSPTRAHIVLIDKNGKIVGGSSEKDGSAVWVAKK